MTAVLVGCTAAFAFGLYLIVTPPGPRPTGRPVDTARLAAQAAAAGLLAVLVLVASGWLVPAVVVGGAAAWAVARWQGRDRRGQADVDRLDALASWIESVRDVLQAGEQPIGAINASLPACQPAVRPAVRRLCAGLGHHDPEVVFRRFADDIDDPVGDLVATGLSIAVRRGARTVPVLTALAEQAREQAERRRLVEAERAPTRREVHALGLIMATLVVGLLVFGRSDYLDAYDTFAGQIYLTAALAAYALLLVRVQRLATFPRAGRFLTASREAAR